MASTTNPISNQIVTSSFISGLEINKPQIREQLFRPYQEDSIRQLWFMINDLGFSKAVGSDTYYNFQKLPSFESFKVKATTSSSTTTTYEIHADSLDANNKFFPRVGHTVMFKPSTGSAGIGRTGVITAVSTSSTYSVTIKAIDGSNNLPSTSNGDVLIIGTEGHGEGTGLPTPTTSKVAKFYNRLQRMKEKISTTGDALVEELWFPIMNETGVEGWYNEAFHDGDYRMAMYIYGMFWFGVYNATTTDADGNVIGFSRGAFAETASYGSQVPYTSNSDVTVFDTIAAYNRQENIDSGTPIWVANGADFLLHWENQLSTEFAGANSDFLQKTIAKGLATPESFGINYNINTISKGSYKYMFNTQGGWDSEQSFGQHPSISKKGLLIPLRRVSDEMSGQLMGSVGFRYKAQGSLNRKFIIGSLAGLGSALPGETIVSEVDTRHHGWLSQQGNEFFGSNAFIEMYDSTT